MQSNLPPIPTRDRAGPSPTPRAGSPWTRAPPSSRRRRRTSTSRTRRGDPDRAGSARGDPRPRLWPEPDRPGVEFDYCCVRAAQTFRRLGYEAVMLNSNPETVSTDYDTSDRLYLEPVTLERVLAVVELEQPLGVVVSLGGQTPLRLARAPRGQRRTAPRRPAAGDRGGRGVRGALRAHPRRRSGCVRPAGERRRRREEARALADAKTAVPSSCARTTSSAVAECAS